MPKSSTTKTKKSPAAKKATAKASPKAKPAGKKAQPAEKKTQAASKKAKPIGDEEVTIDRRTKADRREAEEGAAPAAEELKPRKKVNRRRQIDPTTCERDYSDAEVEFMNAMDEYKRTSGRMFPTCSEVLEVIRGLGYVQLSPAELAAREPVLPVDANCDNDSAQELENDAFDNEATDADSLEEADALLV